MRAVRRIDEAQLSSLGRLDDQVLTGEEVVLGIRTGGFQIRYLPLPRASWRVYPPRSGAEPETLVHDADSAVFAAFDDERPIALACIRCTRESWGDIVDIRVDASVRRTGVASMLLESCTRFAQGRGMRGLHIIATDTNPSLCQFCAHAGFALQGIDRMALIHTQEERMKPLPQRACALHFYRLFEKE